MRKNKKILLVVIGIMIIVAILLMGVLKVINQTKSRKVLKEDESIKDGIRITNFCNHYIDQKLPISVEITKQTGIDTIKYIDEEGKEINVLGYGKNQINLDILAEPHTTKTFDIKTLDGRLSFESIQIEKKVLQILKT